MDHFFASSTFYRILLRHNPEGEAIAQKSKVFEDPIKIFSPKTSISLPIVGVFIDTVAQQTSKKKEEKFFSIRVFPSVQPTFPELSPTAGSSTQ